MRELARAVIECAEAPSSPATESWSPDAAADQPTRRAALMANESIRLARLASTIHLSQAARLMAMCASDPAGPNPPDSACNGRLVDLAAGDER